jgi:hypothetical protein
MHAVPESELSASIGALQGAARSLRDETGRVTAVLDGVARALDRETGAAAAPLENRSPAETAPPARPPAPPRPVAMRTTPSEPAREVTETRGGQSQLWISGLLCALALFASVALLEVELAVAIPVVIAAAVLLQMKWWMPALAAVALALALAIESPSSGGEMTDEIAAMCVVFVLTAGALLLYEIWQRLHVRFQA